MAKEIRETLDRLFQVVISEAVQNPAFAQRLGEAIGQRHEAGHCEPKPARRSAFDPSQLHAVNTLRLHGEAALFGRLEQIKAVEGLKAVAKASGLVLSGSAGKARPSRSELIRGIVEAAKHYDAKRCAATR